jgi:hypothetical protein
MMPQHERETFYIRERGGHMGRGRKECPDCGLITGVRTFACAECGHRFKSKGNPKKAVDKWQDLIPGTRIKSLQGRGPYYLNKNGERVPMGYYGDFIVRDIHTYGVGAIATKGDEQGSYVHIYMGGEGHDVFGTGTNIYYESHKLEYSDKKDHPGWIAVKKKIQRSTQ